LAQATPFFSRRHVYFKGSPQNLSSENNSTLTQETLTEEYQKICSAQATPFFPGVSNIFCSGTPFLSRDLLRTFPRQVIRHLHKKLYLIISKDRICSGDPFLPRGLLNIFLSGYPFLSRGPLKPVPKKPRPLSTNSDLINVCMFVAMVRRSSTCGARSGILAKGAIHQPLGSPSPETIKHHLKTCSSRGRFTKCAHHSFHPCPTGGTYGKPVVVQPPSPPPAAKATPAAKAMPAPPSSPPAVGRRRHRTKTQEAPAAQAPKEEKLNI
jgi:hypothetical protein